MAMARTKPAHVRSHDCRHLLEPWRSQVDELKGIGGTAYPPHDFSDQCTAWLRGSSTDGHNTEAFTAPQPVTR